jgi:hypothetical protein
MTAAIRLLPNMETRMDRITAQQRRSNEERELNLITARAVLNNAAMHRTSDVRNSIIMLEAYGDGRGDLILAHEATGLLTIRERREAHAEAEYDAQAGMDYWAPKLIAIGLGFPLALAVIVGLRIAGLM